LAIKLHFGCMLQGSIGKWRRCTLDIPHDMDIPESYGYHVNLSRKGYRSLIYRSISFLYAQKE